MSLVKCTECGGQVSTEAKACPSCGALVTQPPSRLKVLVVGAALFAGAYAVVNSGQEKPPKAPVDPATQARDEQRGAAVSAVRSLKNSMHDPASFQVEEVLFMADGAACITYRAKNGFGATRAGYGLMTPARQIHSSDQRTAFKKLWDTYCADKSGETITAISRNML